MAEPLNATFFTLKKRDRAVLAPATFMLVLIQAVLIGLLVLLNWGFFSHLGTLFANGFEEPSEQDAGLMVAGMFGLFGFGFLLMIPMYLAFAAYEAACLRWMIRGEAPGLFGLALDHDTWRVYGIYWCWLIGYMVIGTVVSILAMPLMMMSMGDILSNPSPDPVQLIQWQLSVQLPIMLLQYIPMIFLGVRFAPAAATSIARRRFSLFEAWTVTNGRFWALFGSFFLLGAICAAVYLIVNGAGFAFLLGDVVRAMFADWPNVNNEQAEQVVARLFNAQTIGILIALYVFSGLISLGYVLMSYGVNARAAVAALEEGKIAEAPPND